MQNGTTERDLPGSGSIPHQFTLLIIVLLIKKVHMCRAADGEVKLEGELFETPWKFYNYIKNS